MRSTVDLPQPEGPSRATKEPRSACRSTPSSADSVVRRMRKSLRRATMAIPSADLSAPGRAPALGALGVVTPVRSPGAAGASNDPAEPGPSRLDHGHTWMVATRARRLATSTGWVTTSLPALERFQDSVVEEIRFRIVIADLFRAGELQRGNILGDVFRVHREQAVLLCILRLY